DTGKIGVKILKTYEIDFGPVEEKPFPGGNVRPFNKEYRVYIEKKVYDDIIEHSFEDDKIEMGGILIGEVKKDDYGAYLYVLANIRGKYSSSTVSQITFTQETWNYINEIKDKRYSDKKVVGWYHTHPNFGIFLSDMDIFIHENFFGNPYQIALVVDPVAEKEGCFIKQEKEIIPLKRFWVGKTEYKCVQDKSERDLLLARLDIIEKQISKYLVQIDKGKVSKGNGFFSNFLSMCWMALLFLLVFLLLQNIGFFRERENSKRSGEVLIATQDCKDKGIQLRLYAAPLSVEDIIPPVEMDKFINSQDKEINEQTLEARETEIKPSSSQIPEDKSSPEGEK
ncbi:MAG TPA: Mov34/MPN/PAD-1 family protein, partial [Candidatus Eremiobacteraeota bacterium]|nr:Mov34/MPN/PAD-1 family protein [Candidatus Eremiobacteraeota bacterium]